MGKTVILKEILCLHAGKFMLSLGKFKLLQLCIKDHVQKNKVLYKERRYNASFYFMMVNVQ